MLQSPSNYLLVQVKTKYISNMSSIMKMAAIQNGSTVDQTDVVQIAGKIASIPKMVETGLGFEGFSTKDLRVGDDCIFGTQVIYDLILTEDEAADPIYKNRIYWQAQEYFACDIRNLFAVIRDEKIIMVNGWVMLVPPEESRIVVPLENRKTKSAVKSEVLYIGNSKTTEKRINVKSGEVVYYNAMKAAHYQINGKKFCILQQSQIMGKITDKKQKLMPESFSEN